MALERDARPPAFGVALVVAGGLLILFAMLWGPLLVGSFARTALLSYAPERILIGLYGSALTLVGWIFCGSIEKR